jgi:arylsulfotransferase ASST
MRLLSRPARVRFALRASAPLLLLALVVAAWLPVQAMAASPAVTTEPSLRPGFTRAVTDYVVFCPDRSLTVTVRHPRGATVTVDGRRVSEPRTVPIEPGEAVPIRVQKGERTTRHFVRCLPDDFPDWRFRSVGPQTPLWYVRTMVHLQRGGQFVSIFDHHGVPVWWYRSPVGQYVHNAHLIEGNIAYADSNRGGFGVLDSAAYRIVRPDGTVVRTIQTVGSPTDFHDLQRVGRDYLLFTYAPRDHVDLSPYGGPSDATIVDSVIQRINRRGRLVWSWNSRDHISLDETGRMWPLVLDDPRPLPDGRMAYDPTHVNAVEPAGDDLIVSLRNTDAVYRIRMRDSRIRWKLGGTQTPRSLRVVGDPLDYPLGAQHDPRLWRGTLTVHDNGSDLERSPRVVRYAIDMKRRRAILRESIIDPRVTRSFCCGSARKLANGDWVVGWGAQKFAEVLTPQGTLVNEFSFVEDDFFSYRTVPYPRSAISAATLRAGMNSLHAAGAAD